MNIMPFLEGNLDCQLVGSRYEDGDAGPVARVEFDKRWLYITTDDYEGSVMLHIETIPLLIEALQIVHAAILAR